MPQVLGAAVDFTGVTLPFSVTDLLSSATGLMGLFGSFILLGLAVVFAPKLFALAGKALSAVRGKS